ncbi:MAG: PIN domain-containing protein [Pseudorhodoplanes sp.]|nr:PIN domain-containing protein [Pseudorhodoplanes sp.]
MTSVIDSSVILAFANREPGWERAETEIDDGVVSSLVYAEVVTRLTLSGMSMQQIDDLWSVLQIPVEPFDSARARRAGLLVQATARRGLSLADRASLALAPWSSGWRPSPPIAPGRSPILASRSA